MKKLYLLFGFALMGVLFFACQKYEPVVEEEAVDSNEMLSVERSCGQDSTACVTTCISYNMCCCTIEWYFDAPDSLTTLEPFPTFCVAKDECTEDPECTIECVATTWLGNIYDFCEQGPNTLTYLCVSKNTAISITNHSQFLVYVQLTCNDGMPRNYQIPGWTTIEIGISECDHRLGC